MLDLPPKHSAQETKKRDKPAEAITMLPFIYNNIVDLELASEFIKSLYYVAHKTKQLM